MGLESMIPNHLGFEIQDWPILNLPKFSQLALWHGVSILIDAPIPNPMDLVPSAYAVLDTLIHLWTYPGTLEEGTPMNILNILMVA